MKYLNATFLSNLYQYLNENLSCLLYVVEVVPDQAVYFTSYFALVKDIAEAYGSWVAFIIVMFTAILSMISVQQLITYGLSYFKFSGSTDTNNNINNFSSDKFFTRFNFFKFFRK